MANRITAENLTRSAKAPTIRAGVMQAKVIWKTTNTSSGMATPFEKVSDSVDTSTPERNALDRPPTKAVAAAVKARL